MDYYKLSKDDRWLRDNDSPYEVGGRSTDVSQIGYSLQSRIKEVYAVNSVPPEIAKRLNILISHLEVSEDLIGHFIELVSDDVAAT